VKTTSVWNAITRCVAVTSGGGVCKCGRLSFISDYPLTKGFLVYHPKTPFTPIIHNISDMINLLTAGQSRRLEFLLGEAPVEGPGMKSPRSWSRHCSQILTTETIKIWKCHTVHLPILDQYVSRWRT